MFLTLPAAYAADPAPVDCTHLVAWMAGGLSNSNLTRLVQSRGVSFAVTPKMHRELLVAGATPELVNTLSQSHAKQVSLAPADCPASLIEAAELVKEKQFDPAADRISAILENNPHNGALHFVLGYIEQQRGDWDRAFDEYTSSKET